MCVIAVKPRRKKMFSDELIREMFRANPDGAGLMYPDNKGVRIKKGFMSVDEVLSFVHSRNWEDVPVVMHFRIGTAGPNDKYNCHPYAVGKKNIINGHCELGMAHNGILNEYNPRDRQKSKINDTQIFLHTFINNLAPGFLEKPRMRRLIEKESAGNRLCFMTADGKIYKFGDWSTYKGYSFSNLRFLPYSSRFSTSSNWNFGRYTYSGFTNFSSPWEDDCAASLRGCADLDDDDVVDDGSAHLSFAYRFPVEDDGFQCETLEEMNRIIEELEIKCSALDDDIWVDDKYEYFVDREWMFVSRYRMTTEELSE